jgi:hypothetical protein
VWQPVNINSWLSYPLSSNTFNHPLSKPLPYFQSKHLTYFPSKEPHCIWSVGCDSIGGLVTHCGLDGRLANVSEARFSTPIHTCPRPPVQWVPHFFPRRKAAGASHLTTHHHLTPRLKKEWNYTPSVTSWPVLQWTLLSLDIQCCCCHKTQKYLNKSM